LENEKQVFDSEILEDIQRILNALKKSDDKSIQKLMEAAFND
jgi:hypothetical protein